VEAPVVEAPVVEAPKRTRRTKAEIEAAKAPVEAVVETAVEEEEPAAEMHVSDLQYPFEGETQGKLLLFKYPGLAQDMTPQDPQKVVSTHKSAWDIVQNFAKGSQSAQIEKGNSHGNPLAKAAIRSQGGTRIGEVAPAKWGVLVDLFDAIAKADLSSVPDMQSTDTAGYDKLLKKVASGALQAVVEDEL